MITKFLILSTVTAAGVGTVIALNPSEIRPGSGQRSSVSVTSAPSASATNQAPNPVPPPPGRGDGGRHHERPHYVPPNAVNPMPPGVTGGDGSFSDDWSEQDGWHGDWDDDGKGPQPTGGPTRHPRVDEQEDGR
jgi:hypothetical protein